MKRTQNRPLPMGRIQPDEALSFGIVISVFSVLLMGVALNWLAAGLLASASLFYIFVYTMWLKPRTVQNIVIGGAAGAFPPMIGWAAVTGTISVESILLFALIFFWTPPHFWSLALYCNEDYKRADIPMLPVVSGERVTRLYILLYSLVMTPIVFAPYALGMVHISYLACAAVLHGLFVFGAVNVWRDKQGYSSARRMFGYSILYLFALFSFMMVT